MKKFKIYYTSDMHGYVFPTNYADKENKNQGILKFSSLFDKDENTLIIDGGDTIQGSPFITYLIKNNYDKNHPIASLFNQLGYDYITLGNHDFNYGEGYLIDYLQSLDSKVLCSNVTYSKNQHLILPYDIKTLPNGLRLGIIGGTTQYINIWERKENIVNFQITDPFESIKQTLFQIKNQVDFTIVIYHGGFESDVTSGELLGKETGENQAYKIANELDIDLLLTGHQHLRINEHVINGTYVVQTPPNATEACQITIELDQKAKIKSRFLTPEKIKPNFLTRDLQEIENQVQQWLDRPIGVLSKPMLPASHLEMAIKGSSLANFLNSIQLNFTKADISCTSLANEVKGFETKITIRDIVSTFIYPNTLVMYEITGEILKKALERSAEYMDLINGQLVISDRFLKPKIEHYNYDYFMGIDYTINLQKPIGNRIEKISYKNKEVKSDDQFTIVMNNYRATGAGGYEFYKEATLIKEILIDSQELIIEYIENNPDIKVDDLPNYHVIY